MSAESPRVLYAWDAAYCNRVSKFFGSWESYADLGSWPAAAIVRYASRSNLGSSGSVITAKHGDQPQCPKVVSCRWCIDVLPPPGCLLSFGMFFFTNSALALLIRLCLWLYSAFSASFACRAVIDA